MSTHNNQNYSYVPTPAENASHQYQLQYIQQHRQMYHSQQPTQVSPQPPQPQQPLPPPQQPHESNWSCVLCPSNNFCLGCQKCQTENSAQIPNINTQEQSTLSKIKELFIKIDENDPTMYQFNIWSWIIVIIVAIIITSTVSKSFTYVNYNEYALQKDVYGSVSLTPTYEQGRYFRTLNYNFVKFPATYQPVNFESTVFANNGMEFTLTIRFYYKIPKDSVGKIYDLYSQNYGQRVENNAMNVIKNIAPYYSANDYLTNRLEIEKLIAQNISTELLNVVGVIVPYKFVRITNIAFPNILIETSLDSALALQQNELNQINQTAQLILSQTSQLVAQTNANTQLLLQNTNNIVNQIVETAQNEANNVINTARSNGISYMFDILDVTSNNDKKILINAMAIYDNKNSTVFHEVLPNSLQLGI